MRGQAINREAANIKTGLQDSLWVLRSDTTTASRRGLAFEGFEEKEEDSH